MTIVVDAMSAEFGGIRTYVEQLLGHWSHAFPSDEVHVVLPEGATLATGSHVRHEIAVWRPSVLGRPWAQTRQLPRIVKSVQADVVLATMPSTSVRRPGCPVAVVVHDLRHELRPEQFSFTRRVMRRFAYGRAYAVADGFVSVSRRTEADLARCQPGTTAKPGLVAHHGADHVSDWPGVDRCGPSIAFGHHTNKNPGLLLDAWAILAREGIAPPLLIVGLGAEGRKRLAPMVAERDLGASVQLANYLPDDEFREAMASANVVVFPSDFEGFGLPVVEGMSLGKPVVIGPDAGTTEVAGGHAVVMEDWSPGALASAVKQALALDESAVAAAQAWGRSFTWDRTARQTREMFDLLTLNQTSRRA